MKEEDECNFRSIVCRCVVCMKRETRKIFFCLFENFHFIIWLLSYIDWWGIFVFWFKILDDLTWIMWCFCRFFLSLSLEKNQIFTWKSGSFDNYSIGIPILTLCDCVCVCLYIWSSVLLFIEWIVITFPVLIEFSIHNPCKM